MFRCLGVTDGNCKRFNVELTEFEFEIGNDFATIDGIYIEIDEK